MDKGIISHPGVRDTEALVSIYMECFPTRVEEVFGDVHRRTFICDYIRFYLSWDPKNNWVYKLDEKVLGFVIAPSGYVPARAALKQAQVLRWLNHLLLGRYGLPFHIIKRFLTAGFAFNPDLALKRLWGKPYVHLFAVTEGSQGKGIGSRLMGWTLDQYKQQGIHFCWLTVQSDNQRGIEFYQRFGFRIHEAMVNGDFIMVWGDLHDPLRHCQWR